MALQSNIASFHNYTQIELFRKSVKHLYIKKQ